MPYFLLKRCAVLVDGKIKEASLALEVLNELLHHFDQQLEKGFAWVGTPSDIYDAMTLTRVATAPLIVPRTDADAIALPNGQILIVGGRDASGQPIDTLELFTPPN